MYYVGNSRLRLWAVAYVGEWKVRTGDAAHGGSEALRKRIRERSAVGQRNPNKWLRKQKLLVIAFRWEGANVGSFKYYIYILLFNHENSGLKPQKPS
jgi:hypothetical protein